MDTKDIPHTFLLDLISLVDRVGRGDMLDMMTGIKDRKTNNNNNNGNNKNANNSNHNNNNSNMQHLSCIKVNRPNDNIRAMCRATTQLNIVEPVSMDNMTLLSTILNQRQWGLRVGVGILQYF